MGKVNRRRMKVAAVSATMSLVAGRPLASAGAASMGESSIPQLLPMPVASSSVSAANIIMSTAALPHQSTPLTSTFSCGASIFDLHSAASTANNTHAHTHTLCPTGDSSICPSGEYCHAGIIPSQVVDDHYHYLMMERQQNMEQHEMNRLMEERKREYVDRFVCGVSYHRAEMDCSDIILGDHEGEGGDKSDKALPQNTAAHYCPTGQSSVCPDSMKCYAAVSCPRQYHDPEPEIVVIMDTSLRVLDLYAADYYNAYDNVVQLHHHQQTEAVLDLDVNSTAASHVRTLFAESTGGSGQEEGSSSSLSSTSLEWRLLPSSIMGSLSSMLPLGIFLGSSSSGRHPLDELFDVGGVKEELNINGAAVDSAVESVPRSTTDGGAEVSIQMIEAAVQKRARLSSGGGRKMI